MWCHFELNVPLVAENRNISPNASDLCCHVQVCRSIEPERIHSLIWNQTSLAHQAEGGRLLDGLHLPVTVYINCIFSPVVISEVIKVIIITEGRDGRFHIYL